MHAGFTHPVQDYYLEDILWLAGAPEKQRQGRADSGSRGQTKHTSQKRGGNATNQRVAHRTPLAGRCLTL